MVIRFCFAVQLGFLVTADANLAPLCANLELIFSWISGPLLFPFPPLSLLSVLLQSTLQSFFLHWFPSILSLVPFPVFFCTCLGWSQPHPHLQPHPPVSFCLPNLYFQLEYPTYQDSALCFPTETSEVYFKHLKINFKMSLLYPCSLLIQPESEDGININPNSETQESTLTPPSVPRANYPASLVNSITLLSLKFPLSSWHSLIRRRRTQWLKASVWGLIPSVSTKQLCGYE